MISDYKDYYDFHAHDRMLSDQNYIWERLERLVSVPFDIPQTLHMRLFDFNRKTFRMKACAFVIWFCGEAIPVVRIVEDGVERFVYTMEEVPEVLYKSGYFSSVNYGDWKHLIDIFSIGRKPWMATNFTSKPSVTGSRRTKFDIVDMHRELNSPVFCHDYKCSIVRNGVRKNNEFDLFVNPSLMDMSFHKFMCPFVAFQTLERFISNDLAPVDGRVDIKIPDVLKAESHGFDGFSFRKRKRKK